MDTALISLFDVIINGIGLIGIGILIYQFCKERKNDIAKKSNARKIQLGKPPISIWNGSEDDIEIKLNNKDHESDVWIIENQDINSLLGTGLDHCYYAYLRLQNNRFVTEAKVRYWRNICGANTESVEEKHINHKLGTISPDKGYILPIRKSNDLLYFVYSIEYLNEVTERMQFFVIVVVDASTDRVTNRYDVLCMKKRKKQKHHELFPGISWNKLQDKLGDKIAGSLQAALLQSSLSIKQMSELEFSLAETIFENTCSTKTLKQKLIDFNNTVKQSNEVE